LEFETTIDLLAKRARAGDAIFAFHIFFNQSVSFSTICVQIKYKLDSEDQHTMLLIKNVLFSHLCFCKHSLEKAAASCERKVGLKVCIAWSCSKP
jgi:hypothetical protein